MNNSHEFAGTIFNLNTFSVHQGDNSLANLFSQVSHLMLLFEQVSWNVVFKLRICMCWWCYYLIHIMKTFRVLWSVTLLQGCSGSSLRRKKQSAEKDTDHMPFVIKHIPSPDVKPLLVFIDPNCADDQGIELMYKFQWVLNPRQVFDLSQDGAVMAWVQPHARTHAHTHETTVNRSLGVPSDP